MVKILIVEDDKHIAKMIETTLMMGNYTSELCPDGAQAVEMIQKNHYDLILLDVMLPHLDGFEVLTQIQDEHIPVIFLTALQEVTDKVKGLRLGAEDYIVKPFECLELLARIEVVLRRVNKTKQIYCFEHIELNVNQHIVTSHGKNIDLTPKEFEVLLYFLQNVDIAITKERLLAQIWGYDFIGESRTVDIHVQQVRRKLGLQKQLITIPKLGYRLEGNASNETKG